MRTSYRPECVRRDARPDTVTWARRFVASPARTARDVRDRQIVADLLLQVGGNR